MRKATIEAFRELLALIPAETIAKLNAVAKVELQRKVKR